MALWWLLACGAGHAPAEQPLITAWTEQRRYRIGLTAVPEGLELQLSDAWGRPIEEAALSVRPPEAALVDPGECDSVGEARCVHPAGLYLLRLPAATAAFPEGSFEVEIDAPPGLDRATLRSPDR